MPKITSLTDLPAVRAYLSRIGAEPRSLKTAVVKEIIGNYWKDLAVIRFDGSGAVQAPNGYEPTESEASAIKDDFKGASFPANQKLQTLDTDNLPDQIKDAAPEDVFVFRDETGAILMVQVRCADRDGGKLYVPWSYWDDGTWRRAEPEGLLPLWGLDALGDATTVFLHEGAKAARVVREMTEAATPAAVAKLAAHPWGEQLANAVHLGWIGGALSPSRTDWKVLQRLGVKRAYIVSDNDAPGRSAVNKIAFHLHMPTFHVQFTDEWTVGFDLADQFPEKFFKKIEESTVYTGPAFQECIHPATWMTDKIVAENGKVTTVLRDGVGDMWCYIESADQFVCKVVPGLMLSEPILNKHLAPFSHVAETSRLLLKHFAGRSEKVCYRPDLKGITVTDQGKSAINLHSASFISPKAGDVTPWLNYMEYLFPIKEERLLALRWFATIMGYPQTKMTFGLLLISEKHGVGKSTLGTAILSPILGHHNVSWPSESQIIDPSFNDWAFCRRLVFVNEIYAGHSWKAYDKLKDFITEDHVDVNRKYQTRIRLNNFAHVIACSNSNKALKIQDSDRRWFIPTLTENLWPAEKFEEFRMWLDTIGLPIILNWANTFKGYVRHNEKPPLTARKRAIIEASRSPGEVEAARLGEALAYYSEPAALEMKKIVSRVRAGVQRYVNESEADLRKAMQELGCFVYEDRIKIGGINQNVVLNKAAYDAIGLIESDRERMAMIRSFLIDTEKLFESDL